jgi:uncharacterized protein YneF (UPF0154 family)
MDDIFQLTLAILLFTVILSFCVAVIIGYYFSQKQELMQKKYSLDLTMLRERFVEETKLHRQIHGEKVI